MFKVKITYEGQPCRHCEYPVIRKKGGNKIKPGQKYYFKSYFYCESCNRFYMIDSEKVFINKKNEQI